MLVNISLLITIPEQLKTKTSIGHTTKTMYKHETKNVIYNFINNESFIIQQ